MSGPGQYGDNEGLIRVVEALVLPAVCVPRLAVFLSCCLAALGLGMARPGREQTSRTLQLDSQGLYMQHKVMSNLDSPWS